MWSILLFGTFISEFFIHSNCAPSIKLCFLSGRISSTCCTPSPSSSCSVSWKNLSTGTDPLPYFIMFCVLENFVHRNFTLSLVKLCSVSLENFVHMNCNLVPCMCFRVKMYNSCVKGNQELLSISSEDSAWESGEDGETKTQQGMDVMTYIQTNKQQYSTLHWDSKSLLLL